MEEKYRVKLAEDSVYYIRNWITAFEEEDVLNRITNSPITKWVQLRGRRLQNWGGSPHSKGMIAEPIPNWLMKHVDRISDLGIYGLNRRANHVLVNEYLPGQGIMPHEDGPLFHPVIATVSCGSHTVLELQEKENPEIGFKLLLERCSLVVITGKVYTDYLHSISEIKQDPIERWANSDEELVDKLNNKEASLVRDARISLTIRHVPKTLRFGIRLAAG